MIAARSTPKASRTRAPCAGFALLITITMLAFIVLLLLGLSAYTRIETAVAGNTQRQAQARENALFALNIALGQLQKYAGPDQRVTATGENFGGTNGTRHYTGVWPTDPTDYPGGDPLTPLTWLVSGNEGLNAEGVPLNPRAVRPGASGNGTVQLVGAQSAGTGNNTAFVIAPLQSITAPGVPGAAASANTTIGRYAWWVGDQGVKAPVAVPDTTDAVTYAPFDSADLRSRIRQQLSLGAGAADANGNPVFEPRDANNTALVAGNKVSALNQIAFLKNASNGSLGLTPVRQNFHTWSPNNHAVLANTKLGGLRQDLSLRPDLLGSAFVAWANYSAYTESTASAEEAATSILPAYGSDPLRRRLVMTPHQFDGNGSHQIGPVLTYFMITFNVRTEDGSAATRPLEVRARWMVSLWNPYTSALVPEDLRIEISRLPASVTVVNDEPDHPGPIGSFSLSDAYGSPMKLKLPWASAETPAGVSLEDRHSWLPGRVYSWRSRENTSKNSPPDDGYESDFYSQTLSDAGAGVIRSLSLAAVDGDDACHLEVEGSPNLAITIYAVRPDGDVRLASLTSPEFVSSFTTTPQAASRSGYQFSYVFRLAESFDTPATPGAWLTTAGRDVRRRTLPPECFVVAENGDNPAHYGDSYAKILSPERLLSRSTASRTYNEDTPLFELPRAPLLSLGALQHFRLIGSRPFMIGNAWGAAAQLNGVPTAELFDRHFFSGLAEGIDPAVSSAGELLLPSPLLKPLRKADGARVTADDLRATAPDDGGAGRSAKHLLQAAAFNLNSTNSAAWAAVLRGVRFPTPQSFRYLNASQSTGTASDTDVAVVQSGDAHFLRFSHSAQETYKADSGESAPGDADVTPPNTHLFRQGMRTLPAAQVDALAEKIVARIAARHAEAGPFRSMAEFLSGVDDGPSLLEAAIADAGINDEIAEFSSQFLTQGDIMTALAPTLFPRSDTFVLRAYGEAVNPATNATEGRAWCEAVVQRVPDYLDPADAPETAPADLMSEVNKAHGRRFKVVSFRWLTRSDI